MKRLLLTILLLFLPLAARLGAQGFEAHQIFFDAIPFAGGSLDSVRLDLYLAVPYSAIGFERKGSTFIGRYQTRLRVEGNGRSWYDTSFPRTILAPKIEMTNGELPSYEIYQRRVALPAGAYTASVELLDLRSNMATSAKRSVPAVSFAGQPLALSGLMMVKKIREDSGSYVITPMITESIGADADGYFLFFEAYNATGSDRFGVRASYRDGDKPIGGTLSFEKTFPSGRSQQWVRLPVEGMPRGIFTVEVRAYAATDTTRALATATRTVRFEGNMAGVPIAQEELDTRITELRYVASQGEIDSIREGSTLLERQRRFAEFWGRIDPTPGTVANEAMDEYYTRIDYADSHFRTYSAGWMTDKGLIYVVYGPPDHTSTDPFRSDGKAVETWHYFKRGLKISFIDESGFGDFRLTSGSSYKGKYRYGE